MSVYLNKYELTNWLEGCIDHYITKYPDETAVIETFTAVRDMVDAGMFDWHGESE